MSSPSDEWVIVEDPAEVSRKSRLAYERETQGRLERLLKDPKIAAKIRQKHKLLLDDADSERRAYKHQVYVPDPDMESAMLRWEEKKAAEEAHLAYERETQERLERLLKDPKIASEIRQEHKLLQDEAEREMRAYNNEVYVPYPDIESAMLRWEEKKTAAEEAERTRQRKSRQKWRKDAQRALELRRRSKLRRPPPRRRVSQSLLRRRRRKSASPMERWHKQYTKKSRIITPGRSNIVLQTRRSRGKPSKRKRSPFIRITNGGRKTRRTRRTLRRKRKKTRKHK